MYTLVYKYDSFVYMLIGHLILKNTYFPWSENLFPHMDMVPAPIQWSQSNLIQHLSPWFSPWLSRQLQLYLISISFLFFWIRPCLVGKIEKWGKKNVKRSGGGEERRDYVFSVQVLGKRNRKVEGKQSIFY